MYCKQNTLSITFISFSSSNTQLTMIYLFYLYVKDLKNSSIKFLSQTFFISMFFVIKPSVLISACAGSLRSQWRSLAARQKRTILLRLFNSAQVIAAIELSMTQCVFSSLSPASAFIWRHFVAIFSLHTKEYKTGAEKAPSCRMAVMCY